MIDIHSHLIYGVDDGAQTINESVRMILEAQKLGIKAIVATPHFYQDIFDCKGVFEHFYELVRKTSGFGIDLYRGYEVSITPELFQKGENIAQFGLAQSRYLLFELPGSHIPEYSSEAIYKMNLRSIVPIIAHPERNTLFKKNFDLFIRFIEGGCLVQLDAASILGVYGSEARLFAKRLIKLRLAHFVASDAHCSEDYIRWYIPAYKKIERWTEKEYAERLFIVNPECVIQNDPIT